MKQTTRIAAVFVLSLGAAAFLLLPYTVRKPLSSPRNSCIANLFQIQAAKDAWQREHQKTTSDIPTDSDIFGTNLYVHPKPTCMAGGIYTLGRAGDRPKCSIPEHNAW